MKFPKVVAPLLLAFALVSSCASVPPAQAAGLTFHGVHTALSTVQDAEHVFCDASVPLASPVLVCNDLAHKAGLSDDKHRAIARQFQIAFQKEQVYGQAIEAWRLGSAAPSSTDLRTQLKAVTDLIHTLAPSSTVDALASGIQTVLDSISDIEAAIAKAKAGGL